MNEGGTRFRGGAPLGLIIGEEALGELIEDGDVKNEICVF
jgi:hypothetical protein